MLEVAAGAAAGADIGAGRRAEAAAVAGLGIAPGRCRSGRRVAQRTRRRLAGIGAVLVVEGPADLVADQPADYDTGDYRGHASLARTDLRADQSTGRRAAQGADRLLGSGPLAGSQGKRDHWNGQ